MKIWKLAARLLAGVVASAPLPVLAQAAAPATRPWMNSRLSPDDRTKLLLSKMTLDEKIALLHGPMAMPFGPFKMPAGAIGSAGFVPGNERLGIPALQESDASLGVTNPLMVRGPNDMSTALPSSLALAATFDPIIAYEGGRIVGSEARAKTINVQLAGGVDLVRDPRNGRNFEYAGEDPLLAGLMAGESIRGIQSQGIYPPRNILRSTIRSITATPLTPSSAKPRRAKATCSPSRSRSRRAGLAQSCAPTIS